ncbi:alkene reductase [Variovorax sp. PAMC 28711]|uniref:alkene reductase n=1 Tax=Variovorax sp. PAMC 28711 TaxID=1795631 RepID=UPI00078C5D87|nr:alkene reductase [Variovorax sp. PAMC 28711]AMM23539.1 alkene reductase [Variovorax sp. PAMC 28711]
MPSLFDPIRIGGFTAANRIFMAPLTRGRATRDHVPMPLMADYYAQRAGAGLIISEATGISREGSGFPCAPGIWTDAQVQGWKPVTAAVHAAGGRIALQLWHMGRLVHPSFTGGARPVSSSATIAPGDAYTDDLGKQPNAQARPMTTDDIRRLLDDYALASRNAIAAGFDGVQIHAANGYLIDQFLRDNCNFRDDAYGGSVPNRIRLLVEITQRVVDTVGAERTGVRLSPNGEVQGVNDSHPEILFPAAAAALDGLDVAYLALREPLRDGTFGKANSPPVHPAIRKVFRGALILNSDYTLSEAQAALDAGQADAIAFGRAFISNPDLPRRFAEHIPLAPGNMATWYSKGAQGYTDYPDAPEERLASPTPAAAAV